jgi:MULE transposase-like protein/FAR1 DNA-binding domain-containing protein
MDFQPLNLNITYISTKGLKDYVNGYALHSGFAVTVKRSNSEYLVLQCIHGGNSRNTHKLSEESRQRKRLSMRLGCPWLLKAKFIKDRLHWKIYDVNYEHNHDLSADPRLYSQNRKLTGERLSQALNIIHAGASNRTILRFLSQEGVTPTSKDITNLRPRVSQIDAINRVNGICQLLTNQGYVVRTKFNDKNELDSLYFCHSKGVALANRFPEVIIMDATYKTVLFDMPFINMLGVGNLGVDRLRSFLVAGAWISKEDEEAMVWVLENLRNTVYGGIDKPATFAIDNAQATRNAIKIVYPMSDIVLCYWHIQRNFHTQCLSYFEKEADKKALQASVNMLIYCTDEQSFIRAVSAYYQAAAKSSNPERLKTYLERLVHNYVFAHDSL